MRNRLVIFLLLLSVTSRAQISPGDLTKAHSTLEGMSNCIKCHEVGKKVTSAKCLECHKEIQELIGLNKGYHSSAEVKGKECFACHNEHHGKNFEIIRFDTAKFDHRNARWELAGKHSSTACKSCHKSDFIKVKKSQKSSGSYLGLSTNCLDCHADYHQGTLPGNCLVCHSNIAFKPVIGFDHNKTKFALTGSHKTVDCSKCHKVTQENGLKFQKFTRIAFSKCTDCHKDVHDNKFGQDCRKCHNAESFKKVASLTVFNHDKTDYPLRGRHMKVDCKSCHKQSMTTRLSFNLCSDCHKDYHKGQFKKAGTATDCKECHSLDGFNTSNFTVERHNAGNYKLEGPHLATPCFSCHKKGKDWTFRDLKKRCVDCHQNIHLDNIDVKYFGSLNCENCHQVTAWSKVGFDHNTTDFKLTGKHAEANCKKCHFIKDSVGTVKQRFSELKGRCLECHADVHYGQFDTGEDNSCTRCHSFDQWKPVQFNHDNSRFKLDGNHRNVACIKCHKEIIAGTKKYIQYKVDYMGDIRCASCHLR